MHYFFMLLGRRMAPMSWPARSRPLRLWKGMAPLYRIEAAGTATQMSAAQENLVISVPSRSFFLFE
ncbi:MAG: hypothetical protein ACXU9D_22010 [Xanthobacteraceae bacterium]